VHAVYNNYNLVQQQQQQQQQQEQQQGILVVLGRTSPYCCRAKQSKAKMGNLIVTPETLNRRLDEFEERLTEKLEKERMYASGEYYKALDSIWYSDVQDYTGAAEEWKELRNKDRNTTRYYQNQETREQDDVEYFVDLSVPEGLFPAQSRSMAHLIPSDASCSLAWLRALSIVTGSTIDELRPPLFDENLRGFVEGRALEEEETPTMVDGGKDLKNPATDAALIKRQNLEENETGMELDEEDPPVDPENLSAEEHEKASTDVPLKKWKWNFLRLPNHHYGHFDNMGEEKHLIICPIWDPSNEWKPGTGYKLMIAASPTTYKWLMGTEILSEDEPESKWLMEAGPGEPQVATDFLARTVKALAELLVEHGKDDMGKIADEETKFQNQSRSSSLNETNEEEDVSPLECVFKAIEGAIPSGHLSTKSYYDKTRDSSTDVDTKLKKNEPTYKRKAKDFVRNVNAVMSVRDKNLNLHGGKNVLIPKLSERQKNKPILVANLGVYFKGKEHMIPDPFLVVLKAAVNWSTHCHQTLLPACSNHFDRVQDVGNEDNVPEEIITTAGEDAGQGDDASAISLSEILTGQPGDSDFAAMSTVSPPSKTSARVVPR